MLAHKERAAPPGGIRETGDPIGLPWRNGVDHDYIADQAFCEPDGREHASMILALFDLRVAELVVPR